MAPDSAAIDVLGSSRPLDGSHTETRQNIIWLASYPKSGNTWVRVFLRNLMQELAGEEVRDQDLNGLWKHSNWEIAGRHFSEVLEKPIEPSNHYETARVRPEVQRRLANASERPFFTKTHLCYGLDQGYPTINLSATLAVIYIVRNPLDIAISYAHHSGRSFDETIEGMATAGFRTLATKQYVHEVLGSWSQNAASWMGMPYRPVHIVRYEDMLTAPLRIFFGIAEFLHLKPSVKQLKTAIERSSFDVLKQQEVQFSFNERPPSARQFFREGRAGQWREHLANTQISKILDVHSPMMQRLGYLPPDSGINSLFV